MGGYLENKQDSSQFHTYFSNQISVDSTAFFQLQLLDFPQRSEKWVKFQGRIISTNDRPANGKVQVYLERDSLSEKLVYGDLLYCRANFFEIPKPANPHAFDYSAYLNHQDIHHQTFLKSGTWIRFGNDANPLLKLVYETRAVCNSILESSQMKQEHIAVAKALLLGDKELISDELMLTYSASGTLHVLAVSGLHVGIIMLILSFLLNPLKQLPKGKMLFLALALAGIWFYALLTGFSPSILRAAVMFSFVLIGNELQRDTSIYQSLLVSALLLLLIDPHILFQIGFLLSYLAVFGIVFLHPKIYPTLVFKHSLLDKAWQLASVSIAAQIATLPLSLYCFHQFPTYFLFANLLVIPISFVVLILGIIALALHAIPYLSDFLFQSMDWLILLMNEGVRLVEKLPFALLNGLVLMWYEALGLMILIFTVSFSFLKRSKSWLFLSLALCLLFFGSLLLQKMHRSASASITFYAIRDEVVIDVIQGGQITSFTTPTAVNDEANLRFHVYPNRIMESGSYKAEQHYLLTDSTTVIEISGKRLLLMNEHLAAQKFNHKIPRVDGVYLYNATFIAQPIFDHWKQAETPIILGDGLSYKLKRYLKSQLPPTNWYDLRDQGALVINLESFNAR